MPKNVSPIRGRTSNATPPAPSPRAVAGVPEPPSWLSDEGKSEWERVTPELKRLGILSRIDRGILTMACDAWSKWCKAAEEIAEEGLVVKGSKGDRKHPAFQLYRECAALYSQLAKELGISPNARLRMKAPEPEPEDDTDLD